MANLRIPTPGQTIAQTAQITLNEYWYRFFTALVTLINSQIPAADAAPVTKTADFTVAPNEHNLIVNKAGSSCVVTLPNAADFVGREIWIKTLQAQTTVSASANVVPRNSATAGTAILSASAGQWARLVSNGTQWVIMAGS